MEEQGLLLSSSKSLAIMLTTKRDYDKPTFKIGDTVIELSDDVRYLGMQLSSVLGYRKHIEVAGDKGTRTAAALSRLMPNVGGPSAAKRKLLTMVVHSQLLYAAPIWCDALQHEVNRNKLSSPQRKMALRVASAYCTVSYTAIMVVAGIIPIHLLAAEKSEIEQARRDGRDLAEAKREARDRAMNNWQAEWDRNVTGSWTRRLIPRIDVWKNRRWGQLSHHVTQYLTGHGCFNKYLLRFKKRENAVCMYCDHPNDDVEHTFIGCDRW